MNFREGDSVIHWSYGLGQILRLEEREVSGRRSLYYVVQVDRMTVWVPVDGESINRLRPPTPRDQFGRLLEILKGRSQPLPADRRERKAHLHDRSREATAEANCRLFRDLDDRKHSHHLDDSENSILRQTRAAVLGEWACSQSISLAQAEVALTTLMKDRTRTA